MHIRMIERMTTREGESASAFGVSASSLGAAPTGMVRRKVESKKNETLTDMEEREWYRFWFDDVKKHIVPGKSGSVEHNCKMLPHSDARQMWGVAAMAKELCDNFSRYLSYRGYTNSKGSPFAEISWRAEDAGDLLTAMNKADGTPIESKKNASGNPTCSLEVDEGESASAFGADGADTIQRIVDGDPRTFDKETDRLADLIRTYAIRNRSRIPAGIDAFREYQLAILERLHGIGPRAYRHAKKLLLSWN